MDLISIVQPQIAGFVSVDLSGGSGMYNYSFENNAGAVLFDGAIDNCTSQHPF